MFVDLDVLLIDLQDIGARFYTFIWTMYLAMRACERENIRVIVLDRPIQSMAKALKDRFSIPIVAHSWECIRFQCVMAKPSANSRLSSR